MTHIQSLFESLAARYGIAHDDARLPMPKRVKSPDGLTLSYLDWGGEGESVIFIHGGALTAHSWDLVCLALRRDWRCIAIDLRGHGDSDWDSEYRVETAVADIETVVRTLQVPRVHLVGNSLGGLIAANYACTHADSTTSLTLVDVGPNVDFSATRTIRDYIETTEGALSFAAAIQMGMAINPLIDRQALEYRLVHSMQRGADGRLYWKQDRRRMSDYDYFLQKIAAIGHFAPQIQCDVLVARGARSRVFSDEAAQACAESFARGRWVRVADSGHNIHEANPAGFAQALRDFLGSIRPAP